jgi:thioredoxin-related protein
MGEGMVILMVRSLKEITEVIIPHFDKYPLITQKYADYLLFKEVIAIMERKEHLTLEGLNKIVAIRSSINLGLSDKLKEAFPNIIPVIRPYVDLSKYLPLDPN